MSDDCAHISGVEWLPGPRPEEGDEDDRAVRAALACHDAGRALHAWEAWCRRLGELDMECAPAALERIEDQIAEWGGE